MSKQQPTVQTTQNTTNSVAPFITDAQLGLQSYGQGILGSALNSSPNYYVAGLNEDQLSGQDLLRRQAQSAFQTARPTVPSTYGYTPQGYAATGTGGVATYNPTGTGAPALVDAAGIQEQMNPYTSSVIDTTLDEMRKGYAENSADIGARAAASGAYGGSGEAIQRSQLQKNYGDSLASTVAQLQSAGYDKAASLAGTNAQMRNANALSNAGIMNASAQFNAGARNTDAQFNAGALNTAAQYGAGAANTAGQYGASQSLQGAQLQNTFLNDEQTRRMAMINAILNTGNSNQTQLQNILNVPTGALTTYKGLVPSQVSTTSNTVGTQPNTAPSTLQTILGLGGTLLGANVGGSTLGGKLLGSVFG